MFYSLRRLIINTPSKYFIVSGSAEGFKTLNAFDKALVNAGIGDLNLIRVSSILPADCKLIEPVKLESGSLVTVAYACLMKDDAGIEISAGIACGIPIDKKKSGIIMEYSAVDEKDSIENTLIKMVDEAMAYRKVRKYDIKTKFISKTVVKTAAVFAGVVLI